jgi:hypothetical protein
MAPQPTYKKSHPFALVFSMAEVIISLCNMAPPLEVVNSGRACMTSPLYVVNYVPVQYCECTRPPFELGLVETCLHHGHWQYLASGSMVCCVLDAGFMNK